MQDIMWRSFLAMTIIISTLERTPAQSISNRENIKATSENKSMQVEPVGPTQFTDEFTTSQPIGVQLKTTLKTQTRSTLSPRKNTTVQTTPTLMKQPYHISTQVVTRGVQSVEATLTADKGKQSMISSTSVLHTHSISIAAAINTSPTVITTVTTAVQTAISKTKRRTTSPVVLPATPPLVSLTTEVVKHSTTLKPRSPSPTLKSRQLTTSVTETKAPPDVEHSSSTKNTGEEIWWLYVCIPIILLAAIFVTGGVYSVKKRCGRKKKSLSEEEHRLKEYETQL